MFESQVHLRKGGLVSGGEEGAMGERRPRCFYRVNQGGFIRAGKSLDNNVTVRQTGQLLLLLECTVDRLLQCPLHKRSLQRSISIYLAKIIVIATKLNKKFNYFFKLDFWLHYWAA